MKNYHTHTYRCKHATGTEREYIEQAIREGFTTLGFSDHSPWHYDSGFKPTMRMDETEIDDYISTLRALQKEYQDQIEIKIGFEAEYFQDKMPWLKNVLKRYKIDYLILGNHYDESDEYWIYYGMRGQNLASVTRYVDQVIKGMETGLYSYVAHPDLIYFDDRDPAQVAQIRRLCLKALELDIPLEFNMLGYLAGRHYPSHCYLELVKEIGNKMIIGCDAHAARMIDGQAFTRAQRMLEEDNIHVVDEIRYLQY